MHISDFSRPTTLYSLDIIISVGYRVKSSRGVLFRRWATDILNQYLTEGYVVNIKRLEQENDKLKKFQEMVNGKNGLYYTEIGDKRLSDDALVALTLLIAKSNPKEREIIIKIIINLLGKR